MSKISRLVLLWGTTTPCHRLKVASHPTTLRRISKYSDRSSNIRDRDKEDQAIHYFRKHTIFKTHLPMPAPQCREISLAVLVYLPLLRTLQTHKERGVSNHLQHVRALYLGLQQHTVWRHWPTLPPMKHRSDLSHIIRMSSEIPKCRGKRLRSRAHKATVEELPNLAKEMPLSSESSQKSMLAPFSLCELDSQNALLNGQLTFVLSASPQKCIPSAQY